MHFHILCLAHLR